MNNYDKTTVSYITVIETVREYIDTYFKPPTYMWPKLAFEYNAYSRWGGQELLKRLEAEGSYPPPEVSGRIDSDPLDVIEKFISDMDDYSIISDDPRVNYIFEVAREVGNDVWDMFAALDLFDRKKGFYETKRF